MTKQRLCRANTMQSGCSRKRFRAPLPAAVRHAWRKWSRHTRLHNSAGEPFSVPRNARTCKSGMRTAGRDRQCPVRTQAPADRCCARCARVGLSGARHQASFFGSHDYPDCSRRRPQLSWVTSSGISVTVRRATHFSFEITNCDLKHGGVRWGRAA